jgi:hypothetical protein
MPHLRPRNVTALPSAQNTENSTSTKGWKSSCPVSLSRRYHQRLG